MSVRFSAASAALLAIGAGRATVRHSSRLPRSMPARACLLGVSLVLVVGCENALAPAGNVNGTWVALQIEHSLTLDLVQQGAAVSGTATSWAFINPPTRQFTVVGTYARPRLTLTLSDDGAVAAVVTATVQDASHMVGTETFPSGGIDSLSLVRQAARSVSAPAARPAPRAPLPG